jgi:transcriptional regulator with XRE-family HTH domain
MKARALLAWNIRRVRTKAGVSQERLAFDAGIDRAHVGAIERQSTNPTVDLLERLAQTLGVPISEFFANPAKGSPKPLPLPKGRKPSLPRATDNRKTGKSN